MRKKILIQIALFLLLVGPTLALTSFGYMKTRDALTSVVTLRRESIASLSSLIIEERLKRIVDLGTTLVSRAEFQQLLSAGKSKEALVMLQNVSKDFPDIERLFLTDKSGILLGDLPHIPGVIGRSFKERDWYKAVSKNWQPDVSEIYKRSTEPQYNVVAVTIPIKTRVSGTSPERVLGILVFEIKLDIFLEWAKEINIGGNGFIYITNQRGNVVSYLRFNQKEDVVDFSTTPGTQKALEGLQGVEIVYSPTEKEKQVSSVAPIAGHGWNVVVVDPVSIVFNERDLLLLNILIVYAILDFLAAIFAIWILRNRAKVQEANQQLREIDQKKSEFISLASHQLRTPLGSMRWDLELLKPELKSLPSATQERLQEAYKSNLRVIRLVGDLLSVTRIEEGRIKDEPETTNIILIIQSAVKEMESEAESRKVSIETIIKKPKIPEIIIDPKFFREIIQNLLSNAVKYTLSGGKVIVEIDSTLDSVLIAVIDTGIGIPENEKSKIFTKFARAENAAQIDAEGSGLGLYIAKSFINRWGGKIWFESEENKGTTFYVSLPFVSKVKEIKK